VKKKKKQRLKTELTTGGTAPETSGGGGGKGPHLLARKKKADNHSIATCRKSLQSVFPELDKSKNGSGEKNASSEKKRFSNGIVRKQPETVFRKAPLKGKRKGK